MGSNPGYFKQCGGEVASITFEYLSEIVDLTKVDDKKDDLDRKDDDGEICDLSIEQKGLKNQSEQRVYTDGSEMGSESLSHSESLSSSTHQFDENDDQRYTLEANSHSSRDMRKQDIIINNLQKNLQFSENQSKRFNQWIRNAKKAMNANKLPPKLATKLQSQKSKKQRQKEMKVERKSNEKKKSRDTK